MGAQGSVRRCGARQKGRRERCRRDATSDCSTAFRSPVAGAVGSIRVSLVGLGAHGTGGPCGAELFFCFKGEKEGDAHTHTASLPQAALYSVGACDARGPGEARCALWRPRGRMV